MNDDELRFVGVLLRRLGGRVAVTDRELEDAYRGGTLALEVVRDLARCETVIRWVPATVTVDAAGEPDRVPVKGLGFIHGPQDEFGTRTIESALASGEWRRLGWSAAAETLGDQHDRSDQ